MNKIVLKNIAASICALFLSGIFFASPINKEINSGWQFKQARLNNWYHATVPGVVHTDLLDNKKIEDPFFRLNERDLQWIDKEDWIYQTTFDLSPEMFGMNNIRLLFKGLDTYADVYLNDSKILAADNMFREWKVDVKELVKPQGNILRVYFHSPFKIDIPKWDSLPYKYEASNDQSQNGGVFDKKVSIFARKAGYHYGWDWGPRLVTSGIWRPVEIQAWNDARIENIQILQEDVTSKSATVHDIVEVISDEDRANAVVQVWNESSNRLLGSAESNLKKGVNRIQVDFVMKNPQLWWCNGLGEAHLYSFKTKLLIDSKTIDSENTNAGIRSIRLIRNNDKDGQSFYFELNGVPVFAKGANYIPSDNFLPRVTKKKYEKTIEDAVAVNMNMLRVWGGGIYENDYFYELCDRNGLMIWQDFMFACSLYPAEGAMLENIKQEAIDNVKRLRNHPCIVLWCGNNENQVAWFGWGWKESYEKKNPKWAEIIWKQYKDQYFVTLANVVSEYGSGIAYTPSSPFSTYNKGQENNSGDCHYWGVWHSKHPIANYNVVRSRFFSEYGFQSFPEFESVKLYAPMEEDWNITSDVMMSHQRGGNHANGLIETYLLNEYRKPRNFQEFLYMNHILQGDAVKTAMEAHRRDRPYCMGTLYWQINDCWPVASWSSRDYYGRWKALHYFTKKAYADVLVSPIEKEGALDVYVVSDRLKSFSAILTVSALKLNGEVVSKYSRNVKVNANSSNKLFTCDVNQFLKGTGKGDVVIHAELTGKGEKDVYTNNYFLVRQKDVNYPKVKINNAIAKVAGGYEVTLSCDDFARGVFLSLDGIDYFFKDNYFDLLPDKPYKVMVETSLSQSDFEKQLKITSLSEAY